MCMNSQPTIEPSSSSPQPSQSSPTTAVKSVTPPITAPASTACSSYAVVNTASGHRDSGRLAWIARRASVPVLPGM